MKRRRLSRLAALAAASCVFAGSVSFHSGLQNITAAQVQEEGGYQYSVLDDGTIEISGYQGSENAIVIPAELDGKKVTSIGSRAFMSVQCDSIKIPDSVVNIGPNAFFCCTAEEISIPDRVTRIEKSAFYGSGITSIKIPAGITRIEDSMFNSCNGLKQVTIPDNVTAIGESAFERCENLERVVIGNGVDVIGVQAFGNCKKLKTLVIGKNVATIKNYAFTYCSALKDITIQSEKLSKIGKYVFYNNSPKAVIKVPKKKLSAYKKLLKGQKLGKKVKITAG